jgi:hypothetical protein
MGGGILVVAFVAAWFAQSAPLLGLPPFIVACAALLWFISVQAD